MRMTFLGRLVWTGSYTAVLALLLSTSLAAGQGGRFRGLDRDGDGIITRAEWRGNDQSFRNHDWNNDGILSGDEIRSAEVETGDRQAPQQQQQQQWPGGFSDWTEARFSRLDSNGDGALSAREWSVGSELFAAVDRNGDRVISRREFLGLEYGETAAGSQQDDSNDRFERLDRNGDGVVAMNEWPRSQAAFRRLDANRDGALSRDELPAGRQATQNGAYRSGYDRGMTDGRQAGREDRTRRNRWDLDGQRELEQADAGYSAAMGRREDYQAGYRAGFRVGYQEGFGR